LTSHQENQMLPSWYW